MWPLYILAALTALTGASVALHESTKPALPPATGAATQLADNFFVYTNAIAKFVANQPAGFTAGGAANRVADAAVTFPPWYVRDSRWANKVINGTVTIYATAPIPGVVLGDLLAQRTDGAIGAGTTDAARQIISSIHGPTGIYAPAGVPAGVPVYQVRLN